MIGSIWNETSNVDALVALWETDKSASQIAAEIGQGLTKNAIISKAIRMGLPQRAARCSDPIAQAARKDRKREADTNRQRLRRGTVNPRIIKHVEPVSPVDLLNISFASIERFQCRWIDNEDMSAPLYCGHATVGDTSWCAFHKSIVLPTPIRRELSEQELARRREWGKTIGLSRVAAQRSAFDLRNLAAMPVE